LYTTRPEVTGTLEDLQVVIDDLVNAFATDTAA
jgi:hypothetical protein